MKAAIRPLISLIFTLGILAGFFLDKVPSEAFVGLAVTAIIWWFKSRDQEKKLP